MSSGRSWYLLPDPRCHTFGSRDLIRRPGDPPWRPAWLTTWRSNDRSTSSGGGPRCHPFSHDYRRLDVEAPLRQYGLIPETCSMPVRFPWRPATAIAPNRHRVIALNRSSLVREAVLADGVTGDTSGISP